MPLYDLKTICKSIQNIPSERDKKNHATKSTIEITLGAQKLIVSKGPIHSEEIFEFLTNALSRQDVSCLVAISNNPTYLTLFMGTQTDKQDKRVVTKAFSDYKITLNYRREALLVVPWFHEPEQTNCFIYDISLIGPNQTEKKAAVYHFNLAKGTQIQSHAAITKAFFDVYQEWLAGKNIAFYAPTTFGRVVSPVLALLILAQAESIFNNNSNDDIANKIITITDKIQKDFDFNFTTVQLLEAVTLAEEVYQKYLNKSEAKNISSFSALWNSASGFFNTEKLLPLSDKNTLSETQPLINQRQAKR